MGFGRGLRVPLWALTLMVCSIQQKASSTEGVPGKVTIIPPLTTTPVITSFNSAHNRHICSTWGHFHFKTFDGDIYHFPGTCNYVFASHCNTAFEDFNIQIRRTVVGNTPTISSVTMRLDGIDFEMEPDTIVVNGERVQLPYSGTGFNIEKFTVYMKLTVKSGLTLMWNEKDSLMLELDEKYANQTCGLCGDFNGIPTYNEFFSNSAQITVLQFGNMQKLNGPTEDCEDPTPSSLSNCTDEYDVCQQVLTGPSFSECNALVGVDDYIESCVQDLCICDQADVTSCLCNTFAEYSRQCAHAGGQPQNWRTPDLCPMACSFNMQYQECGSPCTDTCTNSERSQLCEDHCVDGCFCPPGTVYDDINNAGCIPLEQCSCVYNGKSYAPGTTYSDNCRSCSCAGGQWSCTELPCPGICSVEGGSHISTYDEKRYNVHGDCTYVLSKFCEEDTFTVLGELRRCGLTETETCLKMVALNINGGQTSIVVKPNGAVFVNWLYTQLPISAANVTIFRPSSFFIVVHTNFGLQLEIQLIPIMQLYIHLDPSFKGRTCGLCGNFDSRQIDDFTAINGVVEGTAPAFANTWKIQAACPNIRQNFEDPCTLSIENEKYAHHWCGLLTDSEGPFATCHPSVNPAAHHTNCMFDTCNCERSEDCMCAALSSYVTACAAKGIQLVGWRTNVCSKYTTLCPKSLNYSYTIHSCQPTCRSLSEPDVTCNVKFVPVDGCTCESGTYMDDSGKCVPANKCPCYYKGTPVLSGEVLHDVGVLCTCSQGKLNCIGDGDSKPTCIAPMVYFDCRNATVGSIGAECQKSCQTLDMHCYNTQCVSGCVCPTGLVSDGKGGCIPKEECPCIHNDATYRPGEKIKVDCNTCVCKNRMWQCTKDRCLGTCAVYGDGHYITFDDKRYTFNGKCEYTLVQDHCGQNNSIQGTFRVITENLPCGTTGTTCSKSIKVFFGNYELILSEEHHELVQRGDGGQLPYKIRYMGMYLVIEANNGLILLWDKKTSIFIKLSADFKGQVCGLCGNYDGNGINDFTTRSQSVVGDVLEFGNSWKVSPSCPDAKCTKDPCSKNPYRKSWSQKQCSIINSKAFAACHSQVEPTKYYEACVTDSCACDTGGDCECFCTAVAAYAQACSEFGVCISWRTPSFCPMFCDYYNTEGECEWHYKPCGAPCMKTCRNPSGRCLYQLPGLEGCYPHCPADKPYFNEDEMNCVDVCGCYDAQGNYHPLGKTFDSRETCQSCECTSTGIECSYDAKACYCYYEGKTYIYKDVIYNTTDGLGWCMIATCDVNGTIHRELYKCGGTTAPPFTFTTISSTPSSVAESTTPETTACVHKICEWTEWYDVSYPKVGTSNGDYETPDNIRAKGHNVCKMPDEVECRAQNFPTEKLDSLGQNIHCSKTNGLICNNKDQIPPICYNYEIRFHCCQYIPCGTSTPISTSTSTPETTSTSPAITPIITTGKTTSRVTAGTTTTMPHLISTTPESTSTICQPKCQWTSWYSEHNPSSSPGDGDIENPDKIRGAGGNVCEHPQDIECRAVDYPELSLSLLGQNLQCNTGVGLLCKNEEQTGKFKMCYDYEVRFLCCNYKHCQTSTTPLGVTTTTTTETPSSTPGKTTPPASSTGSTPPPLASTTTQSTTVLSTTPGVTSGKPVTTTLSTPLTTILVTSPPELSTPSATTGEISTVTATSLQSTPISKPTSTIPTTGTTLQSSTVPVVTTTTLPPAVSTTPESTSTICQPNCQWTSWYSEHNPSSSPGDGDIENPDKIRGAGGNVCEHPQDIECRAVDYPELSLSLLGQNLQCNTGVGLLCKNEEQTGKFKMCYDYEVRFLCCNYKHCQTSTTPLGVTTTATTETPSSTPGKTTPPASSTGSTPPPLASTTTQSTTVLSTTPGVTSGKPVTTTLSTPLTTVLVTSPPELSTPSATTGEISTVTATSLQSIPISKPTSTIPTTGTNLQSSTVPVVTTTTLPLAVSTTPESTSTFCQPKCQWTSWYSEHNPSSSPGDGDIENPDKIRGAGGNVCEHPQDIECRAVDYPELSLSLLGQNLQCNTGVGLLCKNEEQTGKFKMCYDYEVRFLCCDYKHCQTSTTPLGVTTTATTETPSSTPGKTTPPASSTGSTPPPLVSTTTQSTTVLSTTPGVTSGKPVTTTLSTPLTTVLVTSPGELSTPSTTTGEISTATATSLHSTPISKPTSMITTTGTTLPPSTVPQSSTTTLPPLVSTTREGISTPLGPTTPATTETPGSTPGKTTPPASSTGSTPPPLVSTTTQSTTVLSTTPGVTSGKQTTTTLSTPLTTLLVTSPGELSTPSATTGEISTVTATSLQSTPISKPTSTIPTTGTTLQSSTVPVVTTTTLPPAVSTTPESTSTFCQPNCQWTSWYSEHNPSSSPGDGDIENPDKIRGAGGNVCEHPQDIECRAVDYPELSLSLLGQNLQCNTGVGLLCKNKEQTGKFKMCYDYEVRFLCCDYKHCQTSTTPLGVTTTATTETPSSTLGKTTPPASSTGSTPPPLVSTTTQSTTVLSTTPGVTSGKPVTTTLSTPLTTVLVTSPGELSTPSATTREISTVTATSLHSTPISKPTSMITTTGTTLPPSTVPQSSTTTLPPLVSTTQEGISTPLGPTTPATTETPGSTPGKTTPPASSTGSTPPPLVSTTTQSTTVLSTTPGVTSGKQTTTTLSTPLTTLLVTSPGELSTPSATTGEISTVTATSLQSTPISKPTSTIPTTGTTLQSSTVPVVTTTTLPPAVSTTEESTSTICQPNCHWTSWYSEHNPSSSPGDGDIENPDKIRGAGGNVCEHPEDIECRAVDYPELSLSLLGQNLQCNTGVGLLCKNKEQTGKFKMCYDYEVRFLCCDYKHCQTSTTPLGVTTTATTETPSSTPGKTTPPASSTGSTPPPLVSTTTQSTTVLSTTPGVTSGKPVTTTLSTPLTTVLVTSPGELSTPSATTGEISTVTATSLQSTPISKPTSTIPTTGTTLQSSTVPVVTTTTLPPAVSTTPESTSTFCQPNCHWTSWYSEHNPSSSPGDGDIENPDKIRGAGGNVCEHPEDIECRAVDYPELSLSLLGQNLQCNTGVGLLCKNKEQTGKFKMCYDYEVRFLCCDYKHCQTSTTPLGITTTATTETPSSTPGKTTPPASSTGSTPPPLASTTTQSTTVLSTTPGVTSGKPVTTTLSTPLTTVLVTSPGELSTPSATTGEISTVTATSLHSTPISKPTSMITTTGTTLPPSTVPQSSTTTLPPLVSTTREGISTPLGPTTPATTETPGSTPGNTTPPSSSTGSTPPPLVSTTTQSTTVLSTTPGVTSGKQTTTTLSTPHTTLLVTSPGKLSTPSATTGEISTVTATSLQSTPISKPTSTIPTTGTTLQSSTVPVVTTTTLPPAVSTTPESTSTICQPNCQWTSWYSEHNPSSSPGDGDIENPDKIRGAGGNVCEHPQDIECRAVDYPELSLSLLGQNLQCNTGVGLLCKNKEQTGKFKMCYDYEVRFLCCDYKHCQTSTTPLGVTTTATTETPSSTPGKTSPPASSTGSTPPPLVSTTTQSTTVLSTTPGVTSGKPVTTTLSTPLTTVLVTSPGELSTPSATTGEISTVTATSLHSTPISKPTSMITTTGTTLPPSTVPQSSTTTLPPLVSTTREGISTPLGPTTPATTETPGSTPGNTTPPASSTGSTPPPLVSTTTQSTTVLSTTPGVTSGKQTTTILSTPLTTLLVTSPGELSTPSATTGEISTVTSTSLQSTPFSKPTSTIPTTGTTLQSSTVPVVTATTLPPAVSTTPESTSTICQPKCQWTSWYSEHNPSSSPGDGDIENPDKIRGAGGNVCEHPEDIECRAVDYPELSLSLLGQNLQCNTGVGLLCKNKEQTGKFKMCYDYEVRFLCCDYKHCQTSTTPLGVTTTATTETPSSTPGKTTPPASSTGSTPPPLVSTTTQSTTVLSTTPGVTSGKPVTTTLSTPLTTVLVTSPGELSTPSATTGEISTVTATSLHSTPISKPTSMITTTGTTLPPSTVPQSSTTTLPPLVSTTREGISTPLGPTTPATTETPGSTPGNTTPPSSSTGSTPPPLVSTTTQSTTVLSTTPGVTSGKQTTTTLSTPHTTLLVTSPGKLSTPSATTGEISTVTATSLQSTPISKPTSTIPTTGTTLQSSTVPVVTTTTLPPAVSTTPESTSTFCQPNCHWTSWYSEHNPSSSPGDGDIENPDKIRGAGGNVCEHPQDIECRAVDYPELSLSLLGQNLQCNTGVGLLCKNKEQTGKFKMCYDYEVRFLCCDYKHCQTSTTPLGITTTATTETPSSTPGKTTPPASSTGSTPPPLASTTTQSTTVLSTTPGVTSGKPVTTTLSTPLTTVLVTSPGELSTPSATTGEISTVTATSLHSTPISKPTSMITTTGTTLPPSTVPQSSTTTLPPLVSTTREGISTPLGPTTPATTETPGSTPGNTTPPSSSTGSTPPPLVSTTTQSTTVLSTTPGVTSGKQTTTTLSTPHTTLLVTSPGKLSTPSATTGEISTVTATSLQSTPISKPTSTIPTTGTTLQSSTVPVVTTTTLPPAVSTTPESTSTFCQPNCHWTSWYSEHNPSSSPGDGDIENPDKIRGAGGNVCEHPQDIECRAVDYPELSLSLLGQNLQCNTGVGLLCKNKEQTGKFKMCYDYEVRFLCCDYKHCQTSTTPLGITTTATTETPSSTPGKTTPPASSTGSTPPPLASTTTQSTTVLSTTPGVTSGKPVTTTLSTPLTTVLVTSPGELSTPSATTGEISTVTATSLHSTPISKPTSMITTTGTTLPPSTVPQSSTTTLPPLVSTTREGISTPLGPTTPATTETPGSTPGNTTPPASSTGSTPPPLVSTTTQSTTVLSTTPGVTSGKQTTTTLSTPHTTLLVTSPGKLSTPSATTGEISTVTATSLQSTPISKPTSTIPTTGTTLQSSTVPVVTTTTLSPAVSTTPESTSTICQPNCQWTSWYSEHNPSSSPGDGDIENPDKIRGAGGNVCEHPQDIECRAVDYPELSLSLLGQNLQCNTGVGLLCKNKEQTGKFKMCYDYEVRFLCCDYKHCQTSTTPLGVTTTATTETPSSTPGKTSPPASSTGSTPPPLVSTTTQSTTVLSTTPGVTSGKPVTTTLSTPLTTVLVTSPGELSTPSATTGEISTVTATSLHSTPISKPTSMITTTGTTLPPSTVPQSSTTTLPPLVSTTREGISTPLGPTTPATTETPGSTPGNTTPPASSTGSTPPPLVSTTTQSTTVLSTTPGVTSGKQTTTILSTPLTTLLVTSPGELSTPSATTGEISTVTSTSLQSTPFSKPTSTIPTTGTTLQSSTVPVVTATTLPPAVSTTPESTSTICQPKCQWTSWYSEHNPSSSPGDGDIENPDKIRGAGGNVCEHPEDIECRAVDYPELSLSLLGQNLQCNTGVGLLCKNKEQTGKFKMCYDYEVRFLCCDYKHCQTSTTPLGVTTTATTETPSSTPGKTTPPASSTGSKPPPLVSTTTQSTTVLSTTPGVTSGKPVTTTLSTPLTTVLVTSPGELSTPSATTREISTVTATSLHSTPISKPTSMITTTGTTLPPSTVPQSSTTTLPPLVSTTQEGISTPLGPTTPATTETPGSTPGKTTPPASSTGSTPPPLVSTTTQSTTVLSTTPGVTSGKQTTTTLSTPLTTLLVTSPGELSTPSATTGEISTVTATSLQSTPISKPTSTIPTTGTTLQSSTVPVVTTTTLPPAVSTTEESTSTICQPNCHWTSWYSEHNPSSSPGDGDIENPDKIRGAGGNVCEHPEDIECRAVDYPELSLSLLGQNLQCNTGVGLLCKNKEQTGKFKMCYDYEVRFLCCDYKHCQTSTTPLGVTTTATTETPSSTPGKTTPPASSTGSTPSPLVSTTTQSTTVLSTTPGVTSGKPVTTTLSTPLTTVLVTSPGELSTPSATTGEISTVTATSLHSTPISKPTSMITTTGTTLPPSTVPQSSTTTLPPLVSTTREGISTPLGPTTPATTETPGSTPGNTTPPSSSTGSTPPPLVSTTTQSTTVLSTTPGVTSGKQTTTTLSTPHTTLLVTSPGKLSTPSATTGEISTVTATSLQSTPISKPTSTIPTTGTTLQSSTVPVVTTTTLPPAVSTTPESTSTICQPNCQWTSWYSEHNPSSSPGDGDIENPDMIRGAGGNVCEHPQDIECRAVDYPELSLSLLGQNLQCNTGVGLLCKNEEQTGKFKMCYDYEVRFLCCDYKHCQTSTTPLGVTTTATTETPSSTPGKTTPPASSTGSKPPPLVSTTTQSTTVLSTTPGVTSGKPVTTTLSTPLTTFLVTSPAELSTPSATTREISTVTATSLHSTPISKPTSTITTTGTTLPPSTVPQSSTTTLPPLVSTTREGISTPLGPTTPATTETPGSTPGKTTPPASSTGSTLPPLLSTTTQSTTVLSTTPGVTSGKQTTTTLSTPLTTLLVTSPAELSTPSATTGEVFTVTSTSLQSSPISKQTSTIPTTGSTLRSSTLPVGTSSTLTVPFSTLPLVSGTVPSLTSAFTAGASSTSIGSTIGSPTVPLSRTTPCFCHVSGATGGLFSPGEVIYNRTDSSGCSFYALCNKNCEIERFQEPCPSTTSHPSTPSVTTAGTSLSPSVSKPTVIVPSTALYTTTAIPTHQIIIPTPVPGCPDIDPPRKTNETWMLNNCTMATCEGNNKIVVVPEIPVEKPECVSGLPPIKIVDKDGCTERYECECICTGWDNSNYETFGGTYYTFQDNCTYILVKEILNKHGNFSVLVDNYFCDADNNQSCSRSIIVNYNSMEVVLSSQMHEGVRINKVLFNNEPVSGGFTKDGISVTSAGTVMTVEIAAIHAFISFNGLTFLVQLPFSLFQHNTEGQCGICSNDRSDDCRLPNGHNASSCSEMASYWKVYDKNKPYCHGVTPTEPPPQPPTPCTTPSPLCELIVSDLFADCHKVLPPREFYEACLLEACRNSNDSLTCYNVEMYASLCTAKGICTDWRSRTQGKCPYHCPKDKVYDACGPIHPATCDNGQTQDTSEHVAEGCFCPKDKILFNSYTDICVEECGCVGPDGLPKLPGTKWKSNCQECICDPLSVSVQCKPQACETSGTPKCEKEGFVAVPVLTLEDPCCPEMQCKCNTSACPNQNKTCEPGYKSVLFEGDCCVKCERVPDICVVNGTVYRPGMPVPSKPCETCICGSEQDPATQRNLVECKPVTCDTECPMGYEYQVEAGECCGKCVQVACIISINHTTEILKPGEIWQPEGNKCRQYECEQNNNTFISVHLKRKCPIFDPTECESNETELTPDGCCETCKPKTNVCNVHKNQTLIRQNECISSEIVELTYCEGACPSSSVYSNEAKAMQHKCTCCQELKSHRRKVTLTCQDGKSINYDYIYVDECQCMTACIPEVTV